MTRGRFGSLNLNRMKLSFTAFRWVSPAHQRWGLSEENVDNSAGFRYQDD